MAGQFDHLVGELTPGQSGWLPLDEAGNPTGPATLSPPPPPALACAVMVNSTVPLPEGEDLLTTNTGAPLTPPLQSQADPRSDDWVGPDSSVPPSITSLLPNTAISGDPTDIEMLIEGTGFTPNSVIVFAGVDEPTDFHSETSIGTGVKPSLFVVPDTCEVFVRDDAGMSNSLNFTFTAPIGTRGEVEETIDRAKQNHRSRNK